MLCLLFAERKAELMGGGGGWSCRLLGAAYVGGTYD